MTTVVRPRQRTRDYFILLVYEIFYNSNGGREHGRRR